MSISQPVRADDTAYRINTTAPRDPDPELEQPVLEECVANQTVWCLPRDTNISEPQERMVSVIKAEEPIQQAYLILESRESKNLDHHGRGWGEVFFGIALPKVTTGIYREPSPETAQYVAIKRLNKAVVQQCLAEGKRENPYKEIQRMQAIGDNIHVLGCIEALQDETFLYVIMPYCEQESLVEWIPWKRGVSEEQAKAIFKQVLENIVYLRNCGICHRDLSPDNCMIYNGRVVFTDLAMSFKIPVESSLMTPLGGFGKPAYLPPEVFHNLPFDAYACDLWSAAIILFNLLTGEILYTIPHPSDVGFRYFVLARGISQTPTNEKTVEVLQELEEAEQTFLWKIASRCLNLSQEALQVLDQVLRVAMYERWTSEDIERSPFLNS